MLWLTRLQQNRDDNNISMRWQINVSISLHKYFEVFCIPRKVLFINRTPSVKSFLKCTDNFLWQFCMATQTQSAALTQVIKLQPSSALHHGRDCPCSDTLVLWTFDSFFWAQTVALTTHSLECQLESQTSFSPSCFLISPPGQPMANFWALRLMQPLGRLPTAQHSAFCAAIAFKSCFIFVMKASHKPKLPCIN